MFLLVYFVVVGDSLDSVESLIKKHEDFDRAINLQQTKISSIQSTAERLLSSDPEHYAKDEIAKKAAEVEERSHKIIDNYTHSVVVPYLDLVILRRLYVSRD